jgi:O-antigen/teichoic acid export membrane protein
MDMDLTYINAMLLYLLFLPAVNQFQARERYRYEYKMTVLSSVIVSLGTTVVSVVMVVSMKDRLFGRIIGSVIPTILVGAIFFGFFVRKGKRIRPKYWKYALPLCLPFIPHLLSLNMLHTMDRIMITKWCGSEDTAVYSLAYTCGSLITLLMTSMNSAYSPWLGDKLNKDERSEVRKFSKPYIFAFAFCAVGVMAIAPEILLILGSKGYSEAKFVMTPIAAGCVCQFLYTLFVNVEQFKKKTVGMAFASMTAALVNLVLNWIFIPRFGYLAAAYTTLAGYLVLLAIHMALVHRIKYSDVYDYKLIICVVAVMLVIMVLITLLYKLTLIRYIFVGLYAAVCVLIFIKYKSKVLGFLKKK